MSATIDRPPFDPDAQRKAALLRANEIRMTKRRVCAEIAELSYNEARVRVAEIIARPAEEQRGIRLVNVLQAIPQVGEATVSALLALVDAGREAKVFQLTDGQIATLVARLSDGQPMEFSSALPHGHTVMRLRSQITSLRDELKAERAGRQRAEAQLENRTRIVGRRATTAEHFRLVQTVERLTNDRRTLLLAVTEHKRMVRGPAPFEAFGQADDKLYEAAESVKAAKR